MIRSLLILFAFTAALSLVARPKMTPALLAASSRVGGSTTAGPFTYHRVELKAGSVGWIELYEVEFKAGGGSYGLASSTLTSPNSWFNGPVSSLNDGSASGGLNYTSVGAGNWAQLNITTPVAVDVQAVRIAPHPTDNQSVGLRYYTSPDGTTWTLRKEVLQTISTITWTEISVAN